MLLIGDSKQKSPVYHATWPIFFTISHHILFFFRYQVYHRYRYYWRGKHVNPVLSAQNLNNDKKYVYIVLSWSFAVTYPNSWNGRGICAYRTFYVWLRFTFEVHVLCTIVLYHTAIYRGSIMITQVVLLIYCLNKASVYTMLTRLP